MAKYLVWTEDEGVDRPDSRPEVHDGASHEEVAAGYASEEYASKLVFVQSMHKSQAVRVFRVERGGWQALPVTDLLDYEESIDGRRDLPVAVVDESEAEARHE